MPVESIADAKEKNKLEINIEKQINRDQQIFKFLAAGAAPLEHIHSRIFKNADGKLLNKRMPRKRLKRLVKMGYLKTANFPRSRSRYGIDVFALDELGVNEVCNNYAIRREDIRDMIPSFSSMTHEILLSDIIRTIWFEVEQKKYDIRYLCDDRELKRRFRPIKGEKIFYPDLGIVVVPHHRETIRLNIELDTGTKSGHYWKPKIKSWKDVTLIMALNSTRLKIMRDYVMECNRKAPTGFAVVAEFQKKGLTNTEWTWMPGDQKGKLDLI